MDMHSFVKNLSAISSLAILLGCSDINDSWEVKGGGYLKYSIDGGKSYTIELDADDVVRPDYGRSYFQLQTRLKESSRGDQFSIVVNRPTLGANSADPTYSWMIAERSEKGYLMGDSNIVKFDQKDNDTIWTADIDLRFQDCRKGDCENQTGSLHVKGRLRYWVGVEDR
jgi:hypothetical protein